MGFDHGTSYSVAIGIWSIEAQFVRHGCITDAHLPVQRAGREDVELELAVLITDARKFESESACLWQANDG